MCFYSQLINRQNPLAQDYIPRNLIAAHIPFAAPLGDPKRMLQKEAALAAEELFERADDQNLHLIGISGYRSYARQKQLYGNSPYVAPPGTSEHQTGLALDVSCPSISLKLEESFRTTDEGIFLKDYAPLYGFILRYPKGKEHITGYPCEPWHIRYVSKSLSLYLALTGMTLDEYHII